jgi:exodeoxyribonuclease VII large subunit
MEDLWCFNDEALARAIVQCNMPVISGVGHETDFTIADFVADVRTPTPTAAAELCATPTGEWIDKLANLHANLHAAASERLAQQGQTLDRLHARLNAASPRAQLSLQSSQIHSLQLRLHHAAQRSAAMHAQRLSALANRFAPTAAAVLRQHRAKLNTLDAQLHALSPQRVLERGYAVVLDAQGKPLLAPAPAGGAVTLHLAHGSQDAVLK